MWLTISYQQASQISSCSGIELLGFLSLIKEKKRATVLFKLSIVWHYGFLVPMIKMSCLFQAHFFLLLVAVNFLEKSDLWNCFSPLKTFSLPLEIICTREFEWVVCTFWNLPGNPNAMLLWLALGASEADWFFWVLDPSSSSTCLRPLPPPGDHGKYALTRCHWF